MRGSRTAPEELLHEASRDVQLPDLMPLLGHIACCVRHLSIWSLRRRGGGRGYTAAVGCGCLAGGLRLHLTPHQLLVIGCLWQVAPACQPCRRLELPHPETAQQGTRPHAGVRQHT